MTNDIHISCEDVQQFICTHFGEEESSERCQEVREHLEKCTECTDYCDSIDKMIALYRAASPHFPEHAKRELLEALGIGENK
jgi:hypothetical protein